MAGSRLVWLVLALLSLASVHADNENNDARTFQPLVYGGTEATPRAYPWIAALVARYSSSSYDGLSCGGSLISPNHVLTAAHCFKDTTAADFAIELNRHDLSIAVGTGSEASAVRRNVAKITQHPQYNPTTNRFDIAIVTLDAPVNTVTPVLRATSAFYPSTGTLTRIAGWGEIESGATADKLLTARVPIVSEQKCKNAYGSGITSDMICAGYMGAGTPNIDSCQGDSGGPLFTEENGQVRLVGVTSFGDDCASKYAPGVYSRVAHSATKSFVESVINSAASNPTPTPTASASATPDPNAGTGAGGQLDPMYCAPGCTWDMVGDGVCHTACQNSACYDDVDDCVNSNSGGSTGGSTGGGHSNSGLDCSPGCAPDWLGDGLCDDTCYNDACSFDLGDCDAILAEKNRKKGGFRIGALGPAASIALVAVLAVVVAGAVFGGVIRHRRNTRRAQRSAMHAQEMTSAGASTGGASSTAAESNQS
eukprot:TRINITY_DN7268_c0_g1_i1.p1 TRINITY_DN7268_c0_g1~~TRINITY_DN7268_c0_g1_i1.p1  ORF type:complete len:480 (+),score=87.89 TRINITY_DN7268_c0_g1_i1:87-1526(+)